MQLDTIALDPVVASTLHKEYQQAVRADRAGTRSAWRKEDDALRRAYAALAKGRKILNVREAISKAGLQDNGLPRLAILRSDAVVCYCEVSWNGSVRFSDLPSNTWKMKREHYIDFPQHTFAKDAHSGRVHGKTLVPMIPPALRPKDNLSRYFTLWEVDAWELLAPRDPVLLKHIAGDFYAVLAVWDLTELERTILGMRAAALQ